MYVRASPYPVGGRVSICTFDSRGLMPKIAPLRERAGFSVRTTAPAAPALKCWFSGIACAWPLTPTVVLKGLAFGLPPLNQYTKDSRISPPSRIEVSVPGMMNDLGKLPPTRPCPALGAGGPPGYGAPGPGICAT